MRKLCFIFISATRLLRLYTCVFSLYAGVCECASKKKTRNETKCPVNDRVGWGRAGSLSASGQFDSIWGAFSFWIVGVDIFRGWVFLFFFFFCFPRPVLAGESSRRIRNSIASFLLNLRSHRSFIISFAMHYGCCYFFYFVNSVSFRASSSVVKYSTELIWVLIQNLNSALFLVRDETLNKTSQFFKWKESVKLEK